MASQAIALARNPDAGINDINSIHQAFKRFWFRHLPQENIVEFFPTNGGYSVELDPLT